ncbi:MAG: hypothetical protein ACI4WW_03185 [Candidatus Coprovivens sp.]
MGNVKIVKELSNNNISSKGIWIRINGEVPNFSELAIQYINCVDNYIMQLKERSLASQEVYNKLVCDLIEVYKNGCRVDESVGRYSFDSELGFIIENPEEKQGSIYDSQFIRNINACVFSNGIPELYVEFSSRNYVSFEQKNELIIAARLIEYKIMTALKINGFSDELICLEMEKNRDKYDRYLRTINLNDLGLYISEFYNEVITNERKREEEIKLSKRIG